MLEKLKKRIKIFKALMSQAPGGLNGDYNHRRMTRKLLRIAAWSHEDVLITEWGRWITLKELLTGNVDRSDDCSYHLEFNLDTGLGKLHDIDFDGCCFCPTYSLKYNEKKNKVNNF